MSFQVYSSIKPYWALWEAIASGESGSRKDHVRHGPFLRAGLHYLQCLGGQGREPTKTQGLEDQQKALGSGLTVRMPHWDYGTISYMAPI